MADELSSPSAGVCREEAPPTATGGEPSMCACGRPTERISVTVKPTTGGQFAVSAASDDSVDYLKLLVSQKLKVPKERICLLYRNRPLRDGTLEANQVVHGCQLILLPSVESGLMSHRPEQSVMQALENLSPSQVTEFLSGKAPLNLTVRLGEHMMLIQLQLSPAQVAARRNLRPAAAVGTASSAGRPGSAAAPAASPAPAAAAAPSSASAPAAPPPSGPSSSRIQPEPTTPAAASSPASERRPRRCPHQRPRGHEDPSAGLRSQLDTRALTEASRNLTRTLKQLSSEVLTGGTDPKDQDGPSVLLSSPSATSGAASGSAPLRPHPGAIIESMHHHGKGVYSGTFSGTLNPSLQDRMGRPKRDISTIIHILNDLLCASPQYRAEEAAAGAAAAAKATPCAPTGATPAEAAQPPAEPAALDENQATRGKVERLKLVLEERRQRRRQRRSQRSAPYTTSWSATSSRPESAASAHPAAEVAEAEMTEVAPAPALVACGGQSAV